MKNNKGRWHAVLEDGTKMEIPRMASRKETESIRKHGIHALIRRTKNTTLYRNRKRTGTFSMGISCIISPRGEGYHLQRRGDQMEIVYRFGEETKQ